MKRGLASVAAGLSLVFGVASLEGERRLRVRARPAGTRTWTR